MEIQARFLAAALVGAQAQADNYARRCGVAVAAAQYDAGWREGLAERPVPLW